MTKLGYDVFVSDGPARAGDLRMPDGSPLFWNPLSTTLISGEESAVLVDPPFTLQQIDAVAEWIRQSGKTLTHIYATHGHGDHWFGGPELIRRFPTAKLYATTGTIELMRSQATVGREQLWDVIFPGQLPDTPVIAEEVGPDGFQLEGEDLLPIEVGHTDTDSTTVLHVPSLGLVVAGDSVYNGIHQYLLEGGNGGFQHWLDALDLIDGLHAQHVVAGHKNRDLPDSPEAIGETRRYLQDVVALLAENVTPQEFFDEMTRRHPDRRNPSPLWYGGLGLLGANRAATS
jgi:glyoxylase-like metal-dependent hydrolase (beta-lactamase superfamily II)